MKHVQIISNVTQTATIEQNKVPGKVAETNTNKVQVCVCKITISHLIGRDFVGVLG